MSIHQDTLVNATNISAGYRNKIVWQNATFSIKKGEFIGLIGSNGAGKTTLFKMILGFLPPLNGDLEVFGSAPQKGNNRISYIPQRHIFDNDSHIRALEYVRLGLQSEKWGFNLPSQAHKERLRAYETLAMVDSLDLAERPLNELSGGEVQRIFLAQALIGKPELLLLDEPLANLDIRRETQLIQLIHKVAKQHNIAVLLIAHDINPLLPIVDRIIYIANKKLVSGKPKEIINSETLSKLYDANIEVIHSASGRMAVLGIEEAGHHD